MGVDVRHSQTFTPANRDVPSWHRASHRYSKNAVEVAVRLVQSKSFRQRSSVPVVASRDRPVEQQKQADKSDESFKVDFSGNTYYQPNYGSVAGYSTTPYPSRESDDQYKIDWEDESHSGKGSEELKPEETAMETKTKNYKKFKLKISSRDSDDYDSSKFTIKFSAIW